MPRIHRGVLLHPIGQRDIQLLRISEDGWVHESFRPEELASICQTLLQRFQQPGPSQTAQVISLKDDAFGDVREVFQEKIRLEEINQAKEILLCLPILEGIFQVIRDSGIRSIDKIILFNTDRQEHLGAGNAFSRYAEKEPYAFSAIAQAALERTDILNRYFVKQTSRGVCTSVTVVKGGMVDRSSVFPFIEEWIAQNSELFRSDEAVFISSNPGIPSIPEAITTVLSFMIPAKRIRIVEKPEGEKGKPVAVPDLIQYYRDRQTVRHLLETENFEAARSQIRRSILEQNEELVRQCERAASRLGGEARDDGDDLAFLLVRTINLLKNRQYDLGGVLVISCLEQCARRAIGSKWPECILDEYSEEFLDLDKLPRKVRDGIRTRHNESKVRFSFHIYKKLLEKIDTEHELLSLIIKCDNLRDCRNSLLHQATAITRETLEGIAELSLQNTDAIERSPFVELVKLYLDDAASYEYWPRDAASNIRRILEHVTFHGPAPEQTG
ncbi:MAG TPA: hypothetical protein PK176_11130 [Acidobacteriota bacterium]|nr:hypothetical protein [Acidobacteriota bacterium]HQM63856.1 hypothetical protein [Acidobacteriota bacterium]